MSMNRGRPAGRMTTRGRPAYREVQVLDYANATIASEGVAPSYGMICAALGIRTRQEVSRIVARLEQAGKVSRVGHGKIRRLRIVEAV